jgi:dTDP-4-amino-4,6-dideoxygalactose transaminase
VNEQNNRPVPFLDLGLQHRRIADEVTGAIGSVLDRTAFVLSEDVSAFEERYAEYCGVGHCIGVGNGTDALELALRGAGVGAGDEVIIPANTFVATAEAVERAGATVVLADCDEDYLISTVAVAAALTARTKAVIPVHLDGQMAPMKALRDLVGDSVLLIEDAAQSQGASQGGQSAGSFGITGATSFYPGKNLGAYGDAGAVLTDSAEIAQRVRALRNHGGIQKYEHNVVGVNSRLDAIQAAVLLVKLKYLDAWNAERVTAANHYSELLNDLPAVVLPEVVPGNDPVWHLYVVRLPRRSAVVSGLSAAGIATGIHYPAPVHLLPAFSHLGLGRGAMPVAERLSTEICSLPLFPGITVAQQERVVAALRRELG